MTSPTTYEEALEVLHRLTAEHSDAAYFKKAQIVLSDGFHCVDIWVDRAKWKAAAVRFTTRMNRVPICYIMEG